ncbi:uncharacterized protein [Diabrotica undecimpunctata]|uniref:uncharacterized protein n=1 Tax=Diabrotica undecimpunctata TaxID=50387 RepID=UPI003B63CC80
MESKSKYYKCCLVPLCKSTTIKTPNKIFIRLPVDKKRRLNWLRACRRDISVTAQALHVCEDHFNLENDMENYIKFKLMGGQKWMKLNVVPHIFNCQPDRKRAHSHYPRITALKRVKHQLIEDAVASTSSQSSECFGSILQNDIDTLKIDSVIETNQKSDISTQTHIKFRSKSVQCKLDCGDSVSNLSLNIVFSRDIGTSPLKLNVPTFCPQNEFGSDTSKTESESEESVYSSYSAGCVSDHQSYDEEVQDIENQFKNLTLKCTLMKMEKRPRIYLGLPEYAYYTFQLLQNYCKLPNWNIFLTLKKIRTGHSFTLLGDDFGISESYASRIFSKSLPIISKYLRKLILTPNINSIKSNLPIAFRARYSDVLCIIDCLEIEIEKPLDSIKQSLTWSEYKKCNTLKYLISCTPDGIINFISNAFGGRTSDAVIIENSGFLCMLPPKVSIMADRGFKHIEHLLVAKGCKLIRPPSVSSNTKLSPIEVIETKRIASLRIHVERVIRRLREFAFLAPHACVDNKLIPYMDHLIKIACGLVNLQSGLILGK